MGSDIYVPSNLCFVEPMAPLPMDIYRLQILHAKIPKVFRTSRTKTSSIFARFSFPSCATTLRSALVLREEDSGLLLSFPVNFFEQRSTRILRSCFRKLST
jgi:hypothetical protein